MLAFENDSHFEREAEIAILKRTCTRVSFMPSASNVEPRSTNRQTKNKKYKKTTINYFHLKSIFSFEAS